MSVSSRRLIERLSLKTGSFKRELAFYLAKVSPTIPDAGIVLDSLIGSWVDQQEGDRFHLSPLLSDYAAKTLSNEYKETIQNAIAVSLTKGRSLDVSDMNAALLAAWSGQNTAVIAKICMAIFGAEHDELEIIAPHMSMFTLFRTDTSAYPSEPAISQMFRAAQLILLNQESDRGQQFSDALKCFEREALEVEDSSIRTSMSMLAYSKILLQTSKAGLGIGFLELISKLNKILENKDNTLPSEMVEHLAIPGSEGVEAIAFMFLNQSNRISKIRDLLAVFDYLDRSPPALREKLLRAFHHDDFEIDMLVNSAWLREHDADTIDASNHVPIFARLEEYATSWGQAELAICCRKLQAIILDEYGSDKDGALALLDEGLQRYGSTNSELVRAKAKVLYRSDDHKGSLELSKTLIEGDATLSEVEKAFLGRDAGISAENERDFEAARRYYLYGSAAAEKSDLPDMAVMGVGLLADAAIASWHAGDRKTCLQDFVAVLTKMQSFEPDKSQRAARCYAIAIHAIIWLYHDATGKKFFLDGGVEAKIFPGCVSNPDPSNHVTSWPRLPIDMAWYMLAKAENNALLSVGITENLDNFLPNGPLVEGQMLLISAKMYNAFTRLDRTLFVEALGDQIAYYAYAQARGADSINNVAQFNYSRIPIASKEQQISLSDVAEQFVLLYSANCIFKDMADEVTLFVQEVFRSSKFTVRPELLNRLQCDGSSEDFYMQTAKNVFLESRVLTGEAQGTPAQVFELSFKVIQIAEASGNTELFSGTLLPWLRQRWTFCWDRQRFLLSDPSLHGEAISTAFEREGISTKTKVVRVLSSILPTLGLGNQNELREILEKLLRP
ncbi:hypothetical protein [Actibacterium lipolyticum]|uniref:hypothetical protein n=1 Tax=Actibacterium lipolyticum TaxID=1524263 RepID=UPI001131E183|nr:hypothetical protein [Actibacterium lipolyticum]